jgi:phospholipid/cholesterol/gamma-HCH transport system substrate-binding protein
MESRAHALAAGLFTALFGIATAFAVWWLSGQGDASQQYLVVSTRSVTGLNAQAQVRYRGVRAGKVEDIGLDPADSRNILVRISIGEGYPVTRNTTAQIMFQGVTGLAYVQLDDDGSNGEPLVAPPGELPRIALKPAVVDSLTDAAARVLIQVQDLLERANALLSPRNLARIDATLASLESGSAGLDRSLKTLPQVLHQVGQVASDANLRRLQSILANLERTSGEAAPLTVELRQLVAAMQSLSRKVDALSTEAGGELVGSTLPQVNALLQELSGTSRQLARVLQQIEESPQSVLFGPGPRRPGPGETGFGKGQRVKEGE